MIQSITVTNFRNDSIDIDLFHPEKSGFLISSIDGIGFADADINTMDVATIDGSLYSSAKMKTRNITMTIIFYGNNIEELRHKCYKFFPVKKEVRLIFNTDERRLWIEGYVEANEPDIFSNQETASITIVCPDPYFRSTIEHNYTISYVEPLFEFPFSNESLDDKLIVFGEERHMTEHHILYEGDSDTSGLVITFELTGPVNDLRLYNTTTYDYGDGTGYMILKSNMIKQLTGIDITQNNATTVGCKIVVSTIVGNKYLLFTDNTGKKTWNILGAMDRSVSSWLYLVPGDNVLVFTTNGAAEQDMNCIITLQYDTLYGGV